MRLAEFPSRAALPLALALILIAAPAWGAPLTDVPQLLHQPDGSTLECFASGDEFDHRLHDAAGYTIVQDPATGAWVYARERAGELLPTALRPGKSDPAAAGLKPGLRISKERYEARRALWGDGSPARSETILAAPHDGALHSVVIYIRFSGEPEYTDTVAYYDAMFNAPEAGKNSMRNYYLEASYGDLEILSHFFPTPPGTTVVSYQDSHTRNYYKEKSATNPEGYSTDNEAKSREWALLQAAVLAVAPQVPADLPIDADGDGRVDSTCFVVSGSPEGWSDLLWPHMWTLQGVDVRINDKRVYTYSFQLQNALRSSGNGVLCHEMFHVLGAPDLYHYSYDGLEPVGRWDIMESTTNPPQHMGAYMKYRYGQWIDAIPEISAPGTYTLNPLLSPEGQCFKIPCPASTIGEFFVVEFRKKSGTFEGRIPDSGLLIYRINPDRRGNASGPPDEVYLYRPGGTPTQNGSPSAANYSGESCRVQLTDSTSPSDFLTDGSPGGLVLTHVGSSSGDTLTFQLGGTQGCQITCLSFPSETQGLAPLEVYFDAWDQSCECNSTPDYRWDFGDGTSTAEDYPTHTYTAPGVYTYTLTAEGDGGATGTHQGTIEVLDSCALTCVAEVTPASGTAPLTASFAATSAGCSGATYGWNFGDGATSALQDTAHTYAAAGTFPWTLTVSASGQACTQFGTVTVSAPACALSCVASAAPASGPAPLAVQFQSSLTATDCAGSPVVLWEFGDGATSSIEDPPHTYTAQGTYAWSLSITQDGSSCASSGEVEVGPRPVPGDCDGDGTVSIGEVQKAVNMFLGIQSPACGVDCNGDGSVSIGEVQRVVNNFLGTPSPC